MNNKIEIYKSKNDQIQLTVKLDEDTVWLDRQQLSALFGRDVKTIGKHVNNIFHEEELDRNSVVANFATTAGDGKIYQVEHYNLDVIISVGYRVKSQQGIHFRQWVTQRLKEYLIQGYSINKKRLKQRDQVVETLKTGIRIMSRVIEESASESNSDLLKTFTKGLDLLDDYDHEQLDKNGKTGKRTKYPDVNDYLGLIADMYSSFESDVFAKKKDESFDSSVNQIKQKFSGKDSPSESKHRVLILQAAPVLRVLLSPTQ